MEVNIDVHLRKDTTDILSIARSLAEKALSGPSKFIG